MGDEEYVWTDERWRLFGYPRPAGLPVIVLLEPREHYEDPGDLPDELAADLGVMLARIERAVRSVGEIGRVHVCRWGDGSAHLHWWFLARPARIPQADRQLRRDLGRRRAADARGRLASEHRRRRRRARGPVTYSIVARDPETGELGVAVQTGTFGVGTGVPWAEAGVGAVATQSFTEHSYGPFGLELMKAGRSAEEALRGLVAADPQQHLRQVGMVDAKGARRHTPVRAASATAATCSATATQCRRT